MKKTSYIIILLLISMQLFGQQSALKQKITLSVKNESVYHVLHSITEITKLNFTYDSEIIPKNKKISIDKKNCELREILNIVFDKNFYDYKVIGNNIVIQAKSNKQTTSIDYKTIKGKVLDKYTKKPLPFAHVSYKNSMVGTITNQNGEFEIKTPINKYKDSLNFSYLGYKPDNLLTSISDTSILEILLTPKTYNLNGVLISSAEPEKVINKALKSTEQNYENYSSMYRAFFREMNFQDTLLMNKSEAVLSIYKSPYSNKLTEDQIKILKGRKMSLKNRPNISLKLKGGPFYYLKLDVVKYPLHFLKRNSSRYYNFDMQGMTYIKNRSTYVIAFHKKNNRKLDIYKGKLYIDKETNAIARVEFDVTPTESQAINNLFTHQINNMKHNIIVLYKKLHYEINYKYINGTWYLQETQGQEVREIKNLSTKKSTFITTISHLVMTEKTDEQPKRFSNKERYDPNEIFSEQITSYDSEFWKNYKVIIP